jgi:hypothetical protein
MVLRVVRSLLITAYTALFLEIAAVLLARPLGMDLTPIAQYWWPVICGTGGVAMGLSAVKAKLTGSAWFRSVGPLCKEEIVQRNKQPVLFWMVVLGQTLLAALLFYGAARPQPWFHMLSTAEKQMLMDQIKKNPAHREGS